MGKAMHSSSRRRGLPDPLGFNEASRPRKPGQTGETIIGALRRIDDSLKNLHEKVDMLPTRPSASGAPPHTDSGEKQTEDPFALFEETLQFPWDQRIKELKDTNEALGEQNRDLRWRVESLKERNEEMLQLFLCLWRSIRSRRSWPRNSHV